jgi:hypothetical protein
MLSAFLFVLLFNFQNCSRVKLQAAVTAPAKAKPMIAKEVAVTNPGLK